MIGGPVKPPSLETRPSIVAGCCGTAPPQRTDGWTSRLAQPRPTPVRGRQRAPARRAARRFAGSIARRRDSVEARRSEEHTSELQSLMRHSYAVFCLKKKNKTNKV